LTGPPSLPAAFQIYAAATRLISPLAPMVLRSRARRGKEDLGRLGERFGRAGAARPKGPLAWLHGASVGESLSLLPLIDALTAARPGLGILVTSGTTTSAALMAERLPPGAIHQYAPIDTPAATAAFLDHWRPDLGVFVEGELWPNLLFGAKARGVRLALLSAKLSIRSYQNWKRLSGAARRLFGVFDLILARGEAEAFYLKSLGADVAGLADLKFGAEPLPVDDTALVTLRDRLAGRPVILAASTHPGEEELIAKAFSAARAAIPSAGVKPLLAIVPRHPDRGRAIAQAMEVLGLAAARQGAGELVGDAEVFIADRLGELGLWFRLARFAIMGGSFERGVGGHNPLEPARLGVPFVFGPYVDNWSGVYERLIEADATEWVSIDESLVTAIKEALADDPKLKAMAERARAFAKAGDLAARAVPAQVMALLP
jgi:3-deoxy-D-manno-octulosonic-acid transferase